MSTDIRTQFVSKLLLFVASNINEETARLLYPLVTEFVSDYEISSRETAIVEYKSVIPEWCEEYIISKIVRGCKDNSMLNYYGTIKEFFNFICIPACHVTESDAQKYIGYCLRIKMNSKSTVAGKRMVMDDFFKWSAKKGYVEQNPFEDIPVIRFPRTSRVPYTDDEVSKIRNEVDNLRDKAIVETMISTACRVEELCRLNISDVDFFQGTVLLFGKGDKYRVSFMNSEMKYALEKYLESRTDNNPALFVGRRKDRKSGEYERMTTGGVQSMFRDLSNKIGIHEIQPHKFRRYTATLMSSSGADLMDIQKLLGHTNPNTTARYIYCNNDNLKAIHKKIVR